MNPYRNFLLLVSLCNFPLDCLSFYYWFIWALWMLNHLGQVLQIIFPDLSFVFWFCFIISFFHREVVKLYVVINSCFGVIFIFKSSLCLECKEWGGIHPLLLYAHWPPAAPPLPSCYHAAFLLSLLPLCWAFFVFFLDYKTLNSTLSPISPCL